MRWLCYVFALSFLTFIPTDVRAHAIGLTCKLKSDKVEVEVYYDDDSPGDKAKIEVVDAQDKIIAKGITDAKGLWSFAAPLPGKYEVRVDAGAGHRAKRAITIPEVKPSDVAPIEKAEPIACECTAAPQTGSISDGEPSREEFTGVPWLKISIGLTVIGGFAAAFLLVSFLRNR